MKLELQGVSKSFWDDLQRGEAPLTVLDDVSFKIETGAFVCLIGPSGSGKSTIFNLITGLIRPDQGHILLNDQVIDGAVGQVGYMPQRDLLLPWRTVLENAILGAQVMGRSVPEARNRARELLPLFGLQGFADAYPASLSGGMRQRAALLRTVLMDREVILLDEPFGALDALTRREMQRWLLGVWAEFKPTILFITHDVREAVMLADRVLVMTPRPGRVRADFQIDLPRPRRESDESFIRSQSLLYQSLEIGEGA